MKYGTVPAAPANLAKAAETAFQLLLTAKPPSAPWRESAFCEIIEPKHEQLRCGSEISLIQNYFIFVLFKKFFNYLLIKLNYNQ